MMQLAQTSETSIALTFLVMNLEKLLRQFYYRFLSPIFQNHTLWRRIIRSNYLKSRVFKNCLCLEQVYFLIPLHPQFVSVFQQILFNFAFLILVGGVDGGDSTIRTLTDALDLRLTIETQ